MVPTRPASLSRVPEKRFTALVAALLFTMPMGNGLVTNLLLLAILFNAIFSLKASDWLSALKNPVFLLPAFFMVFLTLSLFWSEDRAAGSLQLQTKATLFLAPLVLSASARLFTAESRRIWIRYFVAGTSLVMLLAFAIAAYNTIYHPLEEGLSYFVYERLANTFMHPGYLSTYVGLAMLMLIGELWEARGKQRYLWIGLTVFMFFSLFMLQGRINLLALLMVIAGGGLLYGFRQKAWKWLMIPVAPVVIFAGALLFGPEDFKARYFQLPDFNYDITADASAFNSATYRLAEWTCAMDAISQNPVLGAGIGDNREALQDAYAQNSFYAGMERKFNAHNQYLEVAIVGGWLGLGIFMIWLAGYMVLAIRKGDDLFMALWTFFLLCMLTESMLERILAIVLASSFFPLFLLSKR